MKAHASCRHACSKVKKMQAAETRGSICMTFSSVTYVS